MVRVHSRLGFETPIADYTLVMTQADADDALSEESGVALPF
jgi:hypothetical protein